MTLQLDDVKVFGLGTDAPGQVRPGDINGDNEIDLSDPVRLARGLFVDATLMPVCRFGITQFENAIIADWDGNGTVNLNDVVESLRWQFRDGVPHALGLGCVPVAGCATVCED